MKLRHVLFTVIGGILTLMFLAVGVVAFEENTGKISAHFDAKEKRMAELLAPLIDATKASPKITDVTGPIQKSVRTSWSRHSTPFSETAGFEYLVHGEKSDATVNVEFQYRNIKWTVTNFTVVPAATPFKDSTWTDHPDWNTDPRVELEIEMKKMEQELEAIHANPEGADGDTSDTAVMAPPDPPAAPEPTTKD